MYVSNLTNFSSLYRVEKDNDTLRSEVQAQKDLVIEMEDMYQKKLNEKDVELKKIKEQYDELKTMRSSQKNTAEP